MSERSTGRFADYGRPRRVDGGLRARSARGAIGRSWWSRRFLEVLESFALGTRLTRGRSYARAGQVLTLDITPGRVSAVVQGSRAQPYRVSIAVKPFPAALWSRIENELAGQAFFSARLLAGDLPDELEELFAAAGAPLFPAAVDELTQRCDCPDFAVPCKHLAATFYLLAEAFDADPFELLHWRGRSPRGVARRTPRPARRGHRCRPAAPAGRP
ncbi:SWIM zinc finger family protein, partial [Micromonospora sp. STR1s_6]|nr:SWIM zinc finger family protein [Micromonospora tarensis]